MKKISLFVTLAISLLLSVTVSANIIRLPKLTVKKEYGEYTVLPYNTFMSIEDYDIFKKKPPYIKQTKDSQKETEEPIEEKPKTPFKKLYKYVSDKEIEEMDTIIKTVPLLSQFPDFPTGCESVATVSVLNFYGDDITVGNFIDDYLETDINFYYKDGKRYGPSPYEYFLGNPRTTSSWGCMSPVIANALNKYIGEDRVKNTFDLTLEDLCEKYVKNGHPVIAWTSIHMLEITYTNYWYFEDGTQFFWPNNEHCMVLIGYDDWYYYFSDPYVPAIVRYTKETAQSRFEQMGSQALIINEKKEIYQ